MDWVKVQSKYLTKNHTSVVPIFFQRLNKQYLIGMLLIMVALVLMRFDFVYSGKKMEVARGDTLSEYLNSFVFHHAGITNASVTYLRESRVPVDVLLANKESEGGDRVSVRQNQLIILGPNDQVRVQHQVFSDQALRNHQLQVIAYDLLVVALCFYLGVLLNGFLKSRDRKILYQQIGIVLICTFLVPMLLILVLVVVINTYQYLRYRPNNIERVQQIEQLPPGVVPDQFSQPRMYIPQENKPGSDQKNDLNSSVSPQLRIASPTPAGSVSSYQLQQMNEVSPQDIQTEITYSPQLTPYEI